MSTRRLSLSDLSFDTDQLRSIGVYVGLYGTGFLFLVPYLWMVSTSLKPRSEIYSEVPNLIPEEFTLYWYRYLFTNSEIITWTINTFVLAGTTTIVVLLIDSMIAYSLTRLNWPGQRVVFGMILGSFLVPGIINLVPVFLITSELGLINSLLGVVLPSVVNPLGVFMLYQFFRDIPVELEEAALIDGFSRVRIFVQIILPLMRSALVALGLFIFIWTWNAFVWPLLILQDESLYTLPIGLVNLRDNMGVTEPGIVLTSAVVASIPLLLLFLLLQRQLVEAVELQGTVK